MPPVNFFPVRGVNYKVSCVVIFVSLENDAFHFRTIIRPPYILLEGDLFQRIMSVCWAVWCVLN